MNIVQIGTNRANDNLTSLVYTYNSEDIDLLLLVEPIPIHNETIKSCYSKYASKLHIENIVISDRSDKTIKLWYHPDDLLHSNAGELASLNKQHSTNIRSQYSINDVVYLECKNSTINKLFDKYSLLNIDILYIDTEGFDDKIIYNINFTKYSIKNIYYENLHIDIEKLRNYLKSINYDIEINTINDLYADKATLLE
jgi:hypothetical protein